MTRIMTKQQVGTVLGNEDNHKASLPSMTDSITLIISSITLSISSMTCCSSLSDFTLRRLSELDLGYAPPFSSAVDPLAHAANVIDNKTNGIAKGSSPAEVRAKIDRGEDFILLDVRSPQEVEAVALKSPRVVNIPLGKLRSRLNELPADKEIIAFCRISIRGYEAQRMLDGAGFRNVGFLDGGIMGWPYPLEQE